jgi:hypothetical protein
LKEFREGPLPVVIKLFWRRLKTLGTGLFMSKGEKLRGGLYYVRSKININIRRRLHWGEILMLISGEVR